MGVAAGVLVVGDTALDVVVRHASPIAWGDDTVGNTTLRSGGAAANAAAWLAHLGEQVTLVSRVGDDAAAAQARAELTARGVQCVFTVDPTASTGCVVVLVDATGQRTMFPDRGTNALLRPTDLPPLDGARHLHLSGYVLLDKATREAGMEILATARASGVTTSVDPQSAALLDDTFLDAIRGTDLLLPNHDEYLALGGDRVLDVVTTAAVTRGEHGAYWVDRGGVVEEPALPTECVDTTGAGDAFNAGALRAWLAGSGPQAVLRAGIAAGAAAVAQVGAQPLSRR
ncbi:carbohydrate kinase family protein [Actinokineospora globicatena]|uniref:carbohydrate kinase family protein n=1 Tax=Actinokineospora globicatena TaxID=103729 RepID=UPI0020A5D5A8|nr:PfkB family carbohydrate kinase [Actinokineospora globicatena]MCP2302630.1 Sugar or nucleoside kinase, ribokinase family [Actinokineospora globicatena]GLW75682.1 ribokinase [Actinokineospora globicatena]GLW82523.1 ribokinase [Actinokineospora globicatena]